MKAKNKITEKDYLNAMRKASRELEIELHGKQISTVGGKKIHSTSKQYNRNKCKRIGEED